MFNIRPLLSVNAENSLELNVPIKVQHQGNGGDRLEFATVIGIQMNIVDIGGGMMNLEVVQPESLYI